MKKALCTGFRVATTLFGVFGFIFLPMFTYIAITKYFDLSDNMNAILCLAMFEGIFVQAGILKFFSNKKDGETPWVILKVALLPVAMVFIATLLAWPAMLLEHFGFGNTAQWISVIAWLVFLIFALSVVAAYEPKKES